MIFFFKNTIECHFWTFEKKFKLKKKYRKKVLNKKVLNAHKTLMYTQLPYNTYIHRQCKLFTGINRERR